MVHVAGTVSHPITSREAKRSPDSDATNGLIAVPMAFNPQTGGSADSGGELNSRAQAR